MSFPRIIEAALELQGLVRRCSAEDLVVHKAFASREIDWRDVDACSCAKAAS